MMYRLNSKFSSVNVGDRYMYNAHTQRVCKGIQLPTAANERTDTLRVLGVS